MRPVRGRQDEKSKACQGECDTRGSIQQTLLMTGTFLLFECEEWNKRSENVLLGVKSVTTSGVAKWTERTSTENK